MATAAQSLAKAECLAPGFRPSDGNLLGASGSLAFAWSRGACREDNEVEEGEALDDHHSSRCDPDTDFSYIDVKLSMVLGHVQKEFEGGVSAEKLGSKYGGYGSFLPTHERAPSLFSEPAIIDDHSQEKKPQNVVERVKQRAASITPAVAGERAGNSIGPSVEGDKFVGHTGTGEASVFTLPNKDPKKFTLKIRMGSEGDVRKKNMTVYNEFGLEDNSSASLEDDDNDRRPAPDIELSPERSPLGMIRIMTSHEVPGGRLLSPLSTFSVEPSAWREKMAISNKEEDFMGLSAICRSDCPIEIETDSSRVIGASVGREENAKLIERINHQKDENVGNVSLFSKEKESGSDKSKRSDALEKKSGKGNNKNVLKLSAKASVKERLIVTDSGTLDSKSEKEMNFSEASHRCADGALDRVEKHSVSNPGRGTMFYNANREAVRLPAKDKCSSSECSKLVVKTKPVDRGSPINTFKEVEPNKSFTRKARGGSASVEERKKEWIDVPNQVRRNDSGLDDDVANSRKQMNIDKGLPQRHVPHESGEAQLAQKEKIVISRGTEKLVYGDDELCQMKEFDTAGVGGETTKDVRCKYRNSVRDGQLPRQSKEKVKDNVADHLNDGKKELNSRELLSKNANDDVVHDQKMRLKESHKDVTKDRIKKDGLESQKKKRAKEEQSFDSNAKCSPKYKRDGERDTLFVKHTAESVDIAGHLSRKNLTEAMPDNQIVPEDATVLPARDEAQASAVAAPVVILENWVLCDKCEQWRLLPPRIQPKDLPKKWRCKMQNWLPHMNSCKYTEDETSKALYAILGIAQPPAQVQVDPMQAQIPATTVPSTIPSSVMNQDTNKSRNICKAELDSRKNEVPSDSGPVPQEHNVISGCDNLSYENMVVKKYITKEKEKKRSHMNDGDGDGPRKRLAQEDNHLQRSPFHFDTTKKRKQNSAATKEEKPSKNASINSKQLSYACNTQHHAKLHYGDAQGSMVPVNAEGSMIHRQGLLNPSGASTSTEVGKRAHSNSRQLRARGKLQNILSAGDTLTKMDARQSSSGESADHFKGNNTTESAVLDNCVDESSRKHTERGKGAHGNGTSSGRAVPVGSDDGAASPVKRETSYTTARNAIREAKDLKHRADYLKGKGVECESINLYFSAALKFLHAAALLESAHAESRKPGETTQSILIYTDTATLCEYCATSYERAKEWAVAALAYKCIGIAHMRVVLAKCLSVNRDRNELQGVFQSLHHGDSSSSSSASGVDNITGHIHDMEKVQFSGAKGVVSPVHQSAGNYVIPAQLRSNYGRLLHFVCETTSALEAFDKSQAVYAIADACAASTSYGMEGMSAVKNVVDFGFHDMESFLRLVQLALIAVGH